MMSPADIKLCVHELKEAIKASTDGTITINMGTQHAKMFIDFLQHMDPDMPPAPLCKALGPLLGDHLLNAKLGRLDDIADKLGPLVMLLSTAIAQQERR
ncbi:hypothetical protein LJR220_003407 [Bradyrhizobium sp. LjRoot220]|uniref:hypothetical protein n=1 Tax=Bradyrhizobium sp. LjRoot220 TaxID=3342284 RepID=UPI003ECE3EA9